MKFVACALAVVALATTALAVPTPTPAVSSGEETTLGTNVLSGSPEMVDALVSFAGPAWDSATTSTLIRTEGGALHLDADAKESFPRRGTWVGPETSSQFPFTELLPSWNLMTPSGTGATFEVRTRDQESQEWGEYHYIGHWGRVPHPPTRTIKSDGSLVRVDVLQLARPADAFQMRLRLFNFNLPPGENPSVQRLTVSYSGRIEDDAQRAPFTWRPVVESPRGWDLPVPFVPQGSNPAEIAGSTCSPTSTHMVMAFRGVELPLTSVAMAIYDPEYMLFGNWNRAVAFASQQGLVGYLTRVRNWEQVEHYLANGTPLIASIRFRQGEFPENVLKKTGGHLIVVRGMTPGGDLIVNDPADRERGNGIHYTRKSMQNAWLDKGGVTYVIGPKAP
jgi:hypothetical protein